LQKAKSGKSIAGVSLPQGWFTMPLVFARQKINSFDITHMLMRLKNKVQPAEAYLWLRNVDIRARAESAQLRFRKVRFEKPNAFSILGLRRNFLSKVS
jgi:hypothetical protein